MVLCDHRQQRVISTYPEQFSRVMCYALYQYNKRERGRLKETERNKELEREFMCIQDYLQVFPDRTHNQHPHGFSAIYSRSPCQHAAVSEQEKPHCLNSRQPFDFNSNQRLTRLLVQNYILTKKGETSEREKLSAVCAYTYVCSAHKIKKQ